MKWGYEKREERAVVGVVELENKNHSRSYVDLGLMGSFGPLGFSSWPI
jgi:hypothetical protein